MRSKMYTNGNVTWHCESCSKPVLMGERYVSTMDKGIVRRVCLCCHEKSRTILCREKVTTC